MGKLKKRYLLLRKVNSVCFSIYLIISCVIFPAMVIFLVSEKIIEIDLLLFVLAISGVMCVFGKVTDVLLRKTLKQFFLEGCITPDNMIPGYRVCPNCSEEVLEMFPNIKSIVFEKRKKETAFYSFAFPFYTITIVYESGEEKIIQITKERLENLNAYITLLKRVSSSHKVCGMRNFHFFMKILAKKQF